MNALLALLSLPTIDSLREAGTTVDKPFQSFLNVDLIVGYLEEYKSSLRQLLFELAETRGARDSKGSYSIQFTDGTGFKKEARTKVTLNQDKALALAEQKELPDLIKDIYKPATEEIEQLALKYYSKMVDDSNILTEKGVSEEAIEQALSEGLLTEDDLRSITDITTTYALKKFQ